LRQELALQIALFAPLIAVKGYGTPEVGEAYSRARELCLQIDDPPLLFQVLYGLWGYNLVRMNLDMAREFAQQCLALAEAAQTPALLLEANRMAGETTYHRGEVARAREYFERSRALYDSPRHRSHAALYGQDPGVALLSHGSWTLWHLGYPDQALAWSREAIALAHDVSHPFSQVFALDYASILYQWRGERQACKERTDEAMAISVEQRFTFWLARTRISQGWALVEAGETGRGIAEMRENLAAYRATGSNLFVTYYLILLARACARSGDPASALAALEEGLAEVQATEGHLWEAELYRIEGELLLQGAKPADEAAAEARLRQALDIARRQEARSLELRAAMSLGRLWDRNGKRAEAHALLADTYNWFTEGYDTADLREASALLAMWA
jgi:predicted ATPase